jgi:hypothetical protein
VTYPLLVMLPHSISHIGAGASISLIYLPRLWSRQLRCRFRRESWETWGRDDQGRQSRSGKGIIGWSGASNSKG